MCASVKNLKSEVLGKINFARHILDVIRNKAGCIRAVVFKLQLRKVWISHPSSSNKEAQGMHTHPFPCDLSFFKWFIKVSPTLAFIFCTDHMALFYS